MIQAIRDSSFSSLDMFSVKGVSILEVKSEWRKRRIAFFRERGLATPRYSPWLSVDTKMERVHSVAVADNGELVQVEKPFVDGLIATYSDGDSSRPLQNLIGGADARKYVPLKEFSKEDSKCLETAIDLVTSLSFGSVFSEVVEKIVPLDPSFPTTKTGVGFSNQGAIGAIFVSIPNLNRFIELDWAINLSHEFGHNVLNLYLLVDSIISDRQVQPIYSGLKGVGRPAIKSFHALVALYFILVAIDEMIEKFRCDHDRLCVLKDRREFYLKAYSDTLISHLDCQFTPVGRGIYERINSHFLGMQK